MIHLIFFVFVGIAFITDARKSVIPNVLTLAGTLVGVLFHCLNQGWDGLAFATLGAVTGFVGLILLYVFGALGAGDVKLFASIGALMGFTFVIQCMIYAILFAGVIGLCLLFVRKQVAATGNKLANWVISIVAFGDKETLLSMKRQNNMKFPFMYAVVPAVMLAWHEAFV
ncbi:A24 family peptidase [Paenibacillus sedimenti]|uniref:A24 family peptidase n=1 Tax=Paenibacillus sedimenti TaxID=2770274 RepID=UPI001CB739D7|nr:A24 family peptidase [Paenibacillus sedimenti]